MSIRSLFFVLVVSVLVVESHAQESTKAKTDVTTADVIVYGSTPGGTKRGWAFRLLRVRNK